MRSLVIDDDLVCRRVLSKILRQHGACIIATDGAEGLALIRDAIQAGRPFDLVCLDVMMPLIDGHDVLTALRQMEEQAHLPADQCSRVIMVTAMDDSANLMKAFKEQCDAYLVKPITIDRITTELRKLHLVT
jgi:two-component system chemotaxis response regulator CheY